MHDTDSLNSCAPADSRKNEQMHDIDCILQGAVKAGTGKLGCDDSSVPLHGGSSLHTAAGVPDCTQEKVSCSVALYVKKMPSWC